MSIVRLGDMQPLPFPPGKVPQNFQEWQPLYRGHRALLYCSKCPPYPFFIAERGPLGSARPLFGGISDGGSWPWIQRTSLWIHQGSLSLKQKQSRHVGTQSVTPNKVWRHACIKSKDFYNTGKAFLALVSNQKHMPEHMLYSTPIYPRLHSLVVRVIGSAIQQHPDDHRFLPF